jgi:hypothetical protein
VGAQPRSRAIFVENALIDEDQAFGVKIVLAVEPVLARSLHISAFSLAGMGSLFYALSRAGRETSTPRSSRL